MKKKLAVVLAAALVIASVSTFGFKSEAANGTWSSDSSGWWYEEGGWYPVSQWLWIDGSCYYFKDSGYMACNESIGGSWVGPDGAWDPNHKDSGSGSDSKKDTADDSDDSDNGDDGDDDDYVPQGWKVSAHYKLYTHTMACHKKYWDPETDGDYDTYISENKERWEEEDGKWSVIYLDNDDIPELENEHYEHGSYIIDVLAYNENWDSYVEAWYNDYKDACYVEKTGLITWNNPNDDTGYYHDKTWGKDGEEIPLDDPYMDYRTVCWEFHNDQELFNVYTVHKEVYDSGKVRYYRRYENNSEVASYGYPEDGTEIEMSESEYNSFLNKNYKKLTDGLVLAENLVDKFK